jgi:DNA mismatch repair protein MutL
LTSIHPTKTEIKFDDEHALYAILRASIKHSLGQFNVAPVLDFDRDANLDTPYHYKDLRLLPTIQVDGSFNPFRMIKLISITQFGVQKPRVDRKLGKLIRGIKTRRRFYFWEY